MKKVVLITIGGTIASVSENPLSTTNYRTPPLSGEELLQSFGGVECLDGICSVEVDDFMAMDSASLEVGHWLKLARQAAFHLQRDEVAGVVITHGTDTMEESAYFLNLCVNSSKPVVFSGAMRPASAVSYDGGLNLYNSIIAAASGKLNGCGVTVCMNGVIISAREARKIHPTRPDAFTPVEMGALGWVTDGRVDICYIPAKRHTVNSGFDCTKISGLPEVRIVYGYAGAPVDMLIAAVASGAVGIIIAGVGNGNLSKSWAAAVRENSRKACFVRCSRANGFVNRKGAIDDDEMDTVSGGNLSAQKARILLMFALHEKLSRAEIQNVFDLY